MEQTEKRTEKKPNWCSVPRSRKKEVAKTIGRREAVLYYAEALAYRRRLMLEE